MRHIPRFYCPDAALQQHAVIDLPDMAAHHARVVLRLKDGAAVRLFNAHGEWSGHCHYPDKRTVQVTLAACVKTGESLPDVWLVMAPLKNKDSFDNALRHAVELGVGAIHFVQTAFTQQPKLNLDRIRQQAVDAAQQCGRLSVPVLHDVVPLARCLQNWPSDRLLLAGVEGTDAIPSLLQTVQAAQDHPLAILIGPEGGFSDEEKTNLIGGTRTWVRPVHLGSLVLRSDTAIAAALGVIVQNS